MYDEYYYEDEYLSELPNKIDWGRLIGAFTQEGQGFNFPINLPAVEIEFTREAENTLYATAFIFAGGLLLGAVILRRR